MTLLQFVAFFLLYLVAATFIISGFYIITRGQKTTLPNGGVRIKGKIFKHWSLFWERTNGFQRFYFSATELKEKLRWLREYNSMLGNKLTLVESPSCIKLAAPLLESDYEYIREVVRCEIETDPGDKTRIYLYTEEPIYLFPEWIRFPLSQCPPCMASVGGTLLYWPVVMVSPTLFAWAAPHGVAVQLYCWVIFCLALSSLNKLAYNIIGE